MSTDEISVVGVAAHVERSVADIEAELADALEAAGGDPNEITEAYITGTGNMVSAEDIFQHIMRRSMGGLDSERIHRESANIPSVDISKAVVSGSSQSDSDSQSGNMSLNGVKVVQPPFPPELLSLFLEVDETHFRCVRTKTTDAVGRDFDLVPRVTVEVDGKTSVGAKESGGDIVKQEVVSAEVSMIRDFIADANDTIGFDGVLERAGLDYESIGWAAIEVIRSVDGRIRKIAHVPAERVRVLRGWAGFVELRADSKFIYYQNFGEKVVNPSRLDPVSKKPEPYNPRTDGDLDMGKLEWSFIDYESGESTTDMARSANEILWIPKHHTKSIYYGVPDMVPAIGQILANVHIRDYQLQFFEHNAVPRYAVIIEGGKLSDAVRILIQEYFSTHVKGKSHKTLIIPIPATRGEVKVRFEKLDAAPQESSFLESRSSNNQGIMTAHGVSPAIIGVSEHSELGSGKGLSQAEIYKDRIVTPLQRRWAMQLNRLFGLGLGIQYVVLVFSPLDIRDQKAEQEMFTGYLDRGVLTINEVRLKAGLGDPIEGGGRAFINVQGQGIVFVDELEDSAAVDRELLEAELAAAKESVGANNGVGGDKKPSGSGDPSATA